jgi:GNAT superfamily N-acetyltransferase
MRAGKGKSGIRFKPLTRETWRDFERLFGRSGACGGCWCMWWRQTRREFDEKHGAANKRAMKRIVDSGRVPGILAYSAGEPVGWCSVAPRDEYLSLDRSPVLKRLDDTPVWSIVCFYVDKAHRSGGMMDELIAGAVDHVRRAGAKVVEAYPTRLRDAGAVREGRVRRVRAPLRREAGHASQHQVSSARVRRGSALAAEGGHTCRTPPPAGVA